MYFKSHHLKGSIVGLLLTISLFGCNYNKYVVVSDIAIMNLKDGKMHYAILDSTYTIYDQIKLNDEELKKLVMQKKVTQLN